MSVEQARAFLYAVSGEPIATVLVSESDPPVFLIHRGRRFDRSGTSARLHEDGVEFLGIDYMEVVDG